MYFVSDNGHPLNEICINIDPRCAFFVPKSPRDSNLTSRWTARRDGIGDERFGFVIPDWRIGPRCVMRGAAQVAYPAATRRSRPLDVCYAGGGGASVSVHFHLLNFQIHFVSNAARPV